MAEPAGRLGPGRRGWLGNGRPGNAKLKRRRGWRAGLLRLAALWARPAGGFWLFLEGVYVLGEFLMGQSWRNH